MAGGAKTSDKVPLILAIHGFGDRPEAFSGIFNGLSARARIVLPYGLSSHGDGFSWFPLSRLDPKALAEATTHAANELATLLVDLEQSRPIQGKPIVTGFSQGGMLSFTLAVLHPERIGVALPIAGLLAPALIPSSWPMGKVAPPVHAFHGDADDRVPIAEARDTVLALSKVGFAVTLSEYPNVRHSVSPEMRRDWMAAVDAAVTRAANP
jgi:phospholipase/carboxylesterase